MAACVPTKQVAAAVGRRTHTTQQQQQQPAAACARSKMRRRAAPRCLWLRNCTILPSVCLVVVVASLCCQPEAAEALKLLPSLFSWMQQPVQQTPVAQAGGQQAAAAANQAPTTRHHHYHQQQQQLMTSSSLASGAKSGAPPGEESMLASASVFEPSRAQQQQLQSGNNNQAASQQQQQQVGSALRKPFQSILMLPSKHNQMHLFSSLPKSLFGRFLSGSSNAPTTTSATPPVISAWNQQQQQQLRSPSFPATIGAHNQFNSQRPPQFIHSHHQLPGALSSNQPQYQRAPTLGNQPQVPVRRPARPPGAGRAIGMDLMMPKKHALGFGDSGGDFVIIDSSQMGNMMQQHGALDSLHLPESLIKAGSGDNNEMFAAADEPPAAAAPDGVIVAGEPQDVPPSMLGEQAAGVELSANSTATGAAASSDSPSEMGTAPADANWSANLNNIELTASETYTNNSSSPDVRQRLLAANSESGNNNETATAAATTTTAPATAAAIDALTATNQTATTAARDELATQPAASLQSSANQQQWDSETASSGLIRSQSVPAPTSNSSLATNDNQLNATTSEYLQALYAAAKQASDEDASLDANGGGGNRTQTITLGDGDNQQAILFLDSQSFQRLRQQADARRANESKRMRSPAPGSDGSSAHSDAGFSADSVVSVDSQPGVDSSGDFGDDSGNRAAASFAQRQFGDRPSNVQQPPEASGSSAAATIIVAPGDNSPLGEQLAAAAAAAGSSDEQLESFILGPYKGLTSDNSRGPSQQQLHNPVAAATGAYNANKAPSLLQQAKSFIQFPFNVHTAAAAAATGQGNRFRGQQQASYSSSSSSSKDPMAKEQSAPSMAMPSFVTDGQFHQPSLQQQQRAPQNNNNYQPPGLYGSKVMRQQQQQQSAWPLASRLNHLNQLQLHQDNNNRLTKSLQAAHTVQRPVHAPFQQHASSSYFLMAPSASHLQRQQLVGAKQAKQQQQQMLYRPHLPQMSATQSRYLQPQLASQKQQSVPSANSNVPYFATPSQQQHQLQLQQQPANREQQHRQQQQHLMSQPSGDFGRYGPLQMQQQQGNLLNNMNGYQFVVEHANSRAPGAAAAGASGGQQQFEQLADLARHQRQQQQQQFAQQPQQRLASNQAKKYKSGLYQIDPPKLAEESQAAPNGLEQQLVQMQDALGDGESDDSASELQQQRMAADQKREPDDDDAEPSDDDKQLAQQATETPEVGSAAQFSKQVGASIGVGATAKNSSSPLRGQVFNEPLALDGQRLNELRSLKLTQDITLYDFEMPAQRQQPQRQLAASTGSHLFPNSFEKVPTDNSSPPINFLDTQVYTVPYTINLPSGGGPPRQAQNAFHHFNSYQQHPVLRPLPAAPRSQQAPFQAAQQQQATYQQYQPAASSQQEQVGRFPLPYMAPPAPLRQAPQQQQQQQSFIKPMYLNQINWETHPSSLPSVPALSIQTLDDDSVDDQMGDSAGGQPQQQHYFHYQPMSSIGGQPLQHLQRPPTIYQQQALPAEPLASAQRGRQSATSEQIQYELASQAAAALQQPQQFMLTALHQHQPDQQQQQQQMMLTTQSGSGQIVSELPGATGSGAATTNGATSSAYETDGAAPARASEQQNNWPPGPQVAAGANSQLHDTSSSSDDLDDFSPSSDGDDSVAGSDSGRKQPGGSSAEQNGQLAAQQQQKAQQPPILDTSGSLSSNGQQPPSSPSAFCADRAPGLYADESQRCKAYYQCAPTGHQMFKCNNQTQFNQKTQNCDWWYNVDCGGRQGSQSDFEQAAILVTMSSNGEPAPAKQQQDQRSQQPDREAAASSQEASGATQEDSPQISQEAATPDDNKQESLSALRQQARAKLGRWSGAARQQQQQPKPEDESNSSTSVDLGVGSTESPSSQRPQPEQQASPTSATPVYVSEQQQQQDEALARTQQQTTTSGDEQFSSRSSTTQDPQVASASTETSSEITTTSPALPEPKPQVGANLGDEQALQGAGPSAGSAASAAPQDDQVTTQAAITSTISDSTSTQSSVQAAAAPSTETAPIAEASPLPATSEQQQQQQQPEQRLGQQKLRLLYQQDAADSLADGLDGPNPDAELRQPGAGSAPGGESKRLVQSEFGLGVQQQAQQQAQQRAQQQFREGAKTARSPVRFEFSRNGGASARPHPSGNSIEQLIQSGNLFASDNDDYSPSLMGQQQQQPQYHQYSNHKYSFGDQSNSGDHQQQHPMATIYSTSATQGSVNYVPALDEHFLTAKAVQEAAAAAIAEQSATAEPPATSGGLQAQTAAPTATTSAATTPAALDATTATTTTTTTTSKSKRLDRRFGARLPASSTTATAGKAKAAASPSEPSRATASRFASSAFTEPIAPIS